MSNEHTTDVVTSQIDRLAIGELPEPERRSLLAWLDEEPTRWRACALAFLEAQAWECAAEDSGFSVESSAIRQQPTEGRKQQTAIRNQTSAANPQSAVGIPQFVPWLSAAALILVAFLAGLASARYLPGGTPSSPPFAQPIDHPSDSPSGPLLATVSLPTNLDPRLTAQLQLPVASTANSPPEPSIPDYVRQQWERRGFELTEEIRYLPATLPDGREVMVPITKVHVKYKGTPVS